MPHTPGPQQSSGCTETGSCVGLPASHPSMLREGLEPLLDAPEQHANNACAGAIGSATQGAGEHRLGAAADPCCDSLPEACGLATDDGHGSPPGLRALVGLVGAWCLRRERFETGVPLGGMSAANSAAAAGDDEVRVADSADLAAHTSPAADGPGNTGSPETFFWDEPGLA